MAFSCKASAAGLGGPNVIVMFMLITRVLGLLRFCMEGLMRFCMEGLERFCMEGLERFLVEEVVVFVFDIFNND